MLLTVANSPQTAITQNAAKMVNTFFATTAKTKVELNAERGLARLNWESVVLTAMATTFHRVQDLNESGVESRSGCRNSPAIDTGVTGGSEACLDLYFQESIQTGSFRKRDEGFWLQG